MSIFVKCLEQILQAHGRTINSLYGLNINGNKMKNLLEIRNGATTKSATLNPDEIELIRQKFGLTDDEMLQIRAALAAEALFRLMLDRNPNPAEHWKVVQASEGVFHLLYDADASSLQALRTQTLDVIRNDEDQDQDNDEDQDKEGVDETALREQKIFESLEPIMEIYDAAMLWLDIARDVPNASYRKGYLAMSHALLLEAQDTLAFPPGILEGTSQLEDWRQMLIESINDVAALE